MKNKKAWLTFDDGPSDTTEPLISFLTTHNLPAIFFCRGDHIEKRPAPVIKAIEAGILIGNHSFAHRPAGELTFEEWYDDFEKAEQLINDGYKQAGRKRAGYYYRFPYIDKGDGDRLERRFSEITAHTEFELTNKMKQIQSTLKERGFTQPFSTIAHPLYKNEHIGKELDCLFTYSSCDWMLLDRHRGQWDYKTLDDLKEKMRTNTFQNNEQHTEIFLFHDDPEIYDITTALILAAQENNIKFLPFTSAS